ncbi:MAG: hypothetical protein WD356_08035 [Pseudomonadales bacterium]
MKTGKLLGFVAAVTFCGLASAGEVDTGSVTTFSAGESAVAAEVNANFNALITAINDNATRIAELESPDNSVAGHTYTVFFAGSFLAASVDRVTDPEGQDNGPEFGSVEEFAGEGSFTFDPSSNTGSGEVRDTAGAELGIGNEGGLFFDNDGAEQTSELLTFSWEQVGNRVTVDIVGEDFSLNLVVSEDGSMLVGQATSTGVDTFDEDTDVNFSDITTVILVRD